MDGDHRQVAPVLPLAGDLRPGPGGGIQHVGREGGRDVELGPDGGQPVTHHRLDGTDLAARLGHVRNLPAAAQSSLRATAFGVTFIFGSYAAAVTSLRSAW